MAPYFKAAPGVSCMLGPMDVEARVRRAGQRQARRPNGEVVRPDEKDETRENDNQETDRNLEEM